MNLFWSGLVTRASEHPRINRRSQFDKVFDTALQEIRSHTRR